MIEYFRHEAMNQATVIAGFCEIIDNLLNKRSEPFNGTFPQTLHKIQQLIRNFNDTLTIFREECTFLNDATRELILSLDPVSDITAYFSKNCKIYAALS